MQNQNLHRLSNDLNDRSNRTDKHDVILIDRLKVPAGINGDAAKSIGRRLVQR